MSGADMTKETADILIVDDEESILDFFSILLKKEGYRVSTAGGGKEALELLKDQAFDLVVTDLSMPEVDGMQLLESVKKQSPETIVLMVTAFATAESAVEAMKLGAYDYLLKPFKVDEIKLVIRNALEKTVLRRENEAMKSELGHLKVFDDFVGSGPEMRKIYETIQKVSAGRSSVIIVGESGTGKELVARAIHRSSPRESKPFVSINCGAIPENLIESELFGHVRGAFTGATSNKMGLFEAAHGGTFFLDEVGELPPPVQVKLLRVLQEKTIRRIGSTSASPIDVRIIAATNRDLSHEIEKGRFREDLFYRLNVIQVRVPALRDHKEDIPTLAQHFLGRFRKEQGKEKLSLTRNALDSLVSYNFPGNVRELENIIEQCVALEASDVIQTESLPEQVRESSLGQAKRTDSQKAFPKEGINLEGTLEETEKKLLLEALEKSGGVKKKAAELLGISFRSFRYRLGKLGLDSE